MLGDADRAIDDFNQAIKLAPDHVGALYSRGLTYSNKGQWSAIKDMSSHQQSNNVMAIAIAQRLPALKQYDRAIADYDQASNRSVRPFRSTTGRCVLPDRPG
jgi:tetratricopeptide (TPR) repeat protein